MYVPYVLEEKPITLELIGDDTPSVTDIVTAVCQAVRIYQYTNQGKHAFVLRTEWCLSEQEIVAVKARLSKLIELISIEHDEHQPITGSQLALVVMTYAYQPYPPRPR